VRFPNNAEGGGWRRFAVDEFWVPQLRGPHGFGVPSERSMLAGVKGQVFVRGVEIRIFGPGKPQMIPPSVAQD